MIASLNCRRFLVMLKHTLWRENPRAVAGGRPVGGGDAAVSGVGGSQRDGSSPLPAVGRRRAHARRPCWRLAWETRLGASRRFESSENASGRRAVDKSGRSVKETSPQLRSARRGRSSPRGRARCPAAPPPILRHVGVCARDGRLLGWEGERGGKAQEKTHTHTLRYGGVFSHGGWAEYLAVRGTPAGEVVRCHARCITHASARVGPEAARSPEPEAIEVSLRHMRA